MVILHVSSLSFLLSRAKSGPAFILILLLFSQFLNHDETSPFVPYLCV